MKGLWHVRRSCWIVVGATILAAAFAAGQAKAAFPGANGKIVFRTNRDGNAEIYTMNSGGSDRVDLTRNPAEDVDPRWSPDGRRIVFASNRSGNYDIYTMNADGSGVTRLTDSVATDRRPSWTTDGMILFHSGNPFQRAIYRMNADGSDLHQLTPVATDSAYATASPRGERIAFSGIRDGLQRLYVMNADGGAVRPITSPPGDDADAEANWSPRGNTLVFARFGDVDSNIYTVHADGTDLRQVTETPDRLEFEPAWSPDGTKIVFHGCTNLGAADQHCANYAMSADGAGEREISTPRTPYLDDFSADRLDPFWGLPFSTGTGPSISQANGQLEVSVPSSTLNDPTTGFAGAGVAAACHLLGNFDVQVDYRLLQWPAPQLVNVDFDTFDIVDGSFADTHGMFVFDPGGGTGVSTHFPGPLNTFVPAPEAEGALRFVRTGSTLTAYRLVSGAWTALQSTNDAADEVAVDLNVFTNAPQFSHADVKVAYDNVRINDGTLSCPSWWDDNAPDWQALGRG